MDRSEQHAHSNSRSPNDLENLSQDVPYKRSTVGVAVDRSGQLCVHEMSRVGFFRSSQTATLHCDTTVVKTVFVTVCDKLLSHQSPKQEQKACANEPRRQCMSCTYGLPYFFSGIDWCCRIKQAKWYEQEAQLSQRDRSMLYVIIDTRNASMRFV